VKITRPNSKNNKGSIHLTASKSESNRALIIQALCKGISIENLSDSDDTQTLKRLLSSFKEKGTLDTHHAGTTFRFLTAFLAIQNGEWKLTGSDRMKERPIGILVDSLNSNGATIQYLEKNGYPPLQIKGSPIELSNIEIDGGISSQYISAILLIAPTLENSTKISFTNKITSRPYIQMTLDIMNHFGAKYQWNGDCILIQNKGYNANRIVIESDWSAASYWYQIAAFSQDVSFEILGLRKDSLQGDSRVAEIFNLLGVSTSYENNSIHISKNHNPISTCIDLNLNNTPDIAQTIICTCAGLGIEAKISGLETLVIKETNRLEALKVELKKFKVEIEIIDNHSIHLKAGQSITNPESSIETYNDHRMAMAFAPLSMVTDSIEINHPEVVSKSYPNYWNDLKSVGFSIHD